MLIHFNSFSFLNLKKRHESAPYDESKVFGVPMAEEQGLT